MLKLQNIETLARAIGVITGPKSKGKGKGKGKG